MSKQSEIIEPSVEDKQKILNGTLERLRDTRANLNYHQSSLKRLESIRKYLSCHSIIGDHAFEMADNLYWIRNMKDSVKDAVSKLGNEIDSLQNKVANLQKEIGDNGTQNKRTPVSNNGKA